MSENTTNTHLAPDAPSVAPAGCLLRMFWIVVGNGAIYLSLATIAANKPPLPSSLDFVVGITLVLMIAARWFDVARCDGRTLSNEPATLHHWRRYAVSLVGVTAAAWSLAHLIAGSFSR